MKTKVERQLERGLTVADLIAELEQYPNDAKVVFVCDYGDHRHTQQALPVETIDAMGDDETLADSAYSKSGVALEGLDDDEEAEEDRPMVIVLR